MLEEAFRGLTPREDFLASCDDPWPSQPGPDAAGQAWARRLREQAAELPRAAAPRPYYPARTGAGGGTQPRTLTQLGREFAAYVGDLYARGYLDEPQALPQLCVDEDGTPVDPAEVLSIRIRLGMPVSWPLDPDNWDQDTFLGLIEVFPDLVARPRQRSLHHFGGCGWHYSRFALGPARALYRDRVNRLLADGQVGLRLAETGEDVGRLVHAPADGRTELVERALAITGGPAAGTVEHAVALFRRRGAGCEDKRSACIALAGLLEERRDLLRSDLLSKDEGALFQIANQFAVRHRRADQHGDYDEDYLDWILWWYLATVELTERLLARPAAGGR